MRFLSWRRWRLSVRIRPDNGGGPIVLREEPPTPPTAGCITNTSSSYTQGFSRRPDLAEAIASDELNNRATPQTYAWYVWTLLANNKKEDAYRVFRQHVSGQPLEALELYWMGRMMEALDKNYNARQFYAAADLTRYDLDPADGAYIRKKLEE